MGKTEGNMVALSDTPNEMYGKIMSWSDDLILPAFELCTNIATCDIEVIAKEMLQGVNPRDLKMKLAHTVTSMYHGDKKAKEAGDNFTKTFQKSEIPTNIESVSVSAEALLVDIFLSQGIVSSKTDFRRLVDEHAITNLDKDEKVTSYTEKASNGVYRIGKKRFCKIIIK